MNPIMDQLRALLAEEVLAYAGCERVGNRWSPCPKCGHEGDRRRGAVLVCRTPHRWHCPRCDTTADGPETARIVSGANDWRDVFAWATASGWASPDDGPRLPPVRVRTYTGLLVPLVEAVPRALHLTSSGDDLDSFKVVDRGAAFSPTATAWVYLAQQGRREARRIAFWRNSWLSASLPHPRSFVRAWQRVHTTADRIHIRTTSDGWHICT